MNLNQKSLHARLYRFFYATDTLPSNLCPYFWKLVLATILVIPHTIFILPMLFFEWLTDDDNDFGTRFGLSFVSWLALGFLTAYICSNYNLIRLLLGYSYSKDSVGFSLFWDSVGVIALGIYLVKMWRDSREEKESEPSIITEFIKAKHGKYCPQVKWK